MNPEVKKILDEILNFLLYPKFEGYLLAIKITFLVFGFFFTGYTIWALLKTSWLKRAILIDAKEFLFYRAEKVFPYAKKWRKIKKRLEKGIEEEASLAILEADSFVGEAFTKAGYQGATLSEKVRNFLEVISEEKVPGLEIKIEEIKEAERVKESILRDPSYKIDIDKAKKILATYEKLLETLQNF
jgi:hypothetical protein